MRVTDNLRFTTIERTLTRLTSEQAEAANRVATGLKLTKASDDPLGAAHATRLRDNLQQAATYRANIGLVRSDLELAEGSLAQTMELVNQSRELALQGANGSQTAANRAAMAQQVASIREQMLSLTNTKGSSGYLFAGSQTASPPFALSGDFSGDEAGRRIEVGAGVVMEVGVNGRQAFDAPDGVNVFQVLEALELALQSDDGDQISATLAGLDASLSQMNIVRAQTGLTMNRLDTADATLEQSQLSSTKRHADITNADPFESISRMTQLSATLEQAISVARTTLNTSLARF